MSVLTLTPNYIVKLSVEKRQHFYDVFEKGDLTHRFAGVTGSLGIISKPALGPWAKKEALACVEAALLKRLHGRFQEEEITLNKEWIAEILKEAKARPDKIKDDAADLGTRVHAFIDLIIHGKEPADIPKDLEAPVTAFKEWWKNSGIELVMGDTKVASLIHKFGGSLDALGRREGQFIILDWKTSNAIYPEYALQVAAYAQAFYETYGIYCQEGIIVRFGKKLPIDFETKKIRNLERSFQAFLRAKELCEAMALDHYDVA